MNLYVWIFDIFIIIFIGILAMLTPSLSRRGILFGLTVGLEGRASTEANTIIRKYRLFTALLTLLSTVMIGAFQVIWGLNILTSGALIFFIFLILSPYIWANQATRVIALREPDDLAPAKTATLKVRHYSDYLPWYFELLPLVIIGATLLYLALNYAAAGQNLPGHPDLNYINLNNTVDQTRPKTVVNYFSPSGFQVFIEILLTGLTFLSVKAKALPGRGERDFRRLLIRYIFGLKVLLLLLMAAEAMTFVQTTPENKGEFSGAKLLPLVFLGIIMVSLGYVMFEMIKRNKSDRAISDRQDDSKWKLGIFYVNRQDPSFLVEKRTGLGWTLNFGNPLSIIAMFILILIIGVLKVFTR